MALPQSDYMLLEGGTDNGSSTIYTSDDTTTQNLIKIGDTLKITGTASNNGIYTVSGIQTETGVSLGADGDVYYILKGKSLTAESSDTNRDLRIEVIRPTGDKLCTSPEVDGASGISVWSTNATTDYTTRGNGWTYSLINPTISGNDAKYIYSFADNVLRVCNINESNTSIIKYYFRTFFSTKIRFN